MSSPIREYTKEAVWERFIAREENAGLPIDQEMKERAQKLAQALLPMRAGSIEKWIKARRYAGQVGSVVAQDEIGAKIYSLALRLMRALRQSEEGQSLPEMIPTKKGGEKQGPQSLLFGPGAWASRFSLRTAENSENSTVLLAMGRVPFASGGYNVARECWNVETGEEGVFRSLKTIRPNAFEIFPIWEREARIHLELLKKKIFGILQLHGVIEKDSLRAFWLERCDGDLHKDRNQLLKHKISIAKQLLQTFVELHSDCYVHRDLKLSNIFWKKNPSGVAIRVADFGSSCLFKDRNSYAGTPHFQPPEAWAEQFEADCDLSRMISGIDNWGIATSLLELQEIRFPAIYELIEKELYPLRQAKLSVEREDFKAYVKKHFKDVAFKESDSAYTIYDQVIRDYFIPKVHQSVEPIREEYLNSKDPYQQMIGHLLDPNPNTRWTAKEALEHLERFYP